jgi:hypothetical protein
MSSSEEKLELKVDIDTPRRKSENNISELSENTFNRKVYWGCCSGSRIDKRAVQFFSKLLISLMIITFCLFQLHTLDKCDSDIYLSLLTMILGVWVGDAPKLQ